MINGRITCVHYTLIHIQLLYHIFERKLWVHHPFKMLDFWPSILFSLPYTFHLLPSFTNNNIYIYTYIPIFFNLICPFLRNYYFSMEFPLYGLWGCLTGVQRFPFLLHNIQTLAPLHLLITPLTCIYTFQSFVIN